MGTASTMTALSEALGMMLPALGHSRDRLPPLAAAEATGRAACVVTRICGHRGF